jgi:hypothetical protein
LFKGKRPAGALDLAAADNAARVGEQHYLEQNRGRTGRGAGGIIEKVLIQRPQIEFVVQKMIQRVFAGAGQ